MKFLLCFFLTWSFAHAETFRSRIDSIEQGEGDEATLLKFENGRVGFIDHHNKNLEHSFSPGDLVEVKLGEDLSVISGSSVEAPKVTNPELPPPAKVNYVPTNLSSLGEAQAIFSRMNRKYQNESQCYNRAHIWAYEEFNRSGLNSMKLFMFFTSRYIRNYRYKWWFHVTPMTYVNGVPMTLDRRYSSAPRNIKYWTDDFIYSRRECPIVNRYADYRNNQQAEDCYLIPVSQYFWQPRDIETRDRTGAVKTSFIQREINHAYNEAF